MWTMYKPNKNANYIWICTTGQRFKAGWSEILTVDLYYKLKDITAPIFVHFQSNTLPCLRRLDWTEHLWQTYMLRPLLIFERNISFHAWWSQMMLQRKTPISKTANAKIIIRDTRGALWIWEQHLRPRPKSMHLKRGAWEEQCLFTVHTKISVTSLRQATSFPCGVRDSEYTQSLGCSNRCSTGTNVGRKKRVKIKSAGQRCKKAGKPFCAK